MFQHYNYHKTSHSPIILSNFNHHKHNQKKLIADKDHPTQEKGTKHQQVKQL